MKTQPQNLSELEDLRPVNKRSKTRRSSNPIPVDLILKIFLRLPANSIARFRCVSKRCASILRLPYFTELFLTRSLARPQLLFACKKNEHVFFFTSHMPHENSSLSTAKHYRMKIPYKIASDIRFSSIRGLVFVRIWRGLMGKGKGHVSVICNPSTGQSLILPKVRSKIGVRSYFGYDPVKKQYKVLSMIGELSGRQWLISGEHQVLTLGESSWRKIKRSRPYILGYKNHHICINGVLYCRAETSLGNFIIVCFDVRSEKFKFVQDINPYTQKFRCAPLINYNGKLASLGPKGTIDGRCTSIKLRVLEDIKKQEWSEHIYVLPDLWKNIVGGTSVRFVGVTRTNEIVMCSSALRCLMYYNTERNTIRRVEIQGMEAVKHSQIFTLHDHVEDDSFNIRCLKFLI